MKLQEPLARYALATAAVDPQRHLNSMALGDIFYPYTDSGTNNYTKIQSLSWISDQFSRPALKRLFEDSQGEFFMDDHQYAEIALYMMNCMSTESLQVLAL